MSPSVGRLDVVGALERIGLGGHGKRRRRAQGNGSQDGAPAAHGCWSDDRFHGAIITVSARTRAARQNTLLPNDTKPFMTPSNPTADHLTHFDATGQAHMVDVGAKDDTHRIAVAAGTIRMQPATLALITSGTAKKGDVLGIARIAAIMASKRTSDLMPLCHPLADHARDGRFRDR